MSIFQWCPRSRNYEEERAKFSLRLVDTQVHPLLPDVKVTIGQISGLEAKSNALRKNEAFCEVDELDPLSEIAVEPLTAFSTFKKSLAHEEQELTENSNSLDRLKDVESSKWKEVRSEILRDHTTSEKLSISTSFVGDEDKGFVQFSAIAQDESQRRLSELDLAGENLTVLKGLTQKDYIKKINHLNQELIKAWQNNQRVKSLKIVIQCAKMLSHTDCLMFYPSKFVLVTDIFQTFGQLVYDRIYMKSSIDRSGKAIPLPDDFTSKIINDHARETCENWFLKIASIRELIPRIYAELSILKCARFLDDSLAQRGLFRLAQMINGVGDPIVANYLRGYLCRVSMNITSKSAVKFLTPTMKAMLYTLPLLNDPKRQERHEQQEISHRQYQMLFLPIFKWIFYCAIKRLPLSSYLDLLVLYKELSDQANKSNKQISSRFTFVLESLIENFPSEFVVENIILFVRSIREIHEADKYRLYKCLGQKLLEEHTIDLNLAKPLLNDAWGTITLITDAKEYLSCVEVWVGYVARYMGNKEINILLRDLINHMNVDRAYEEVSEQLYGILKVLIADLHDLTALFSMPNFVSFLDLFRGGSHHISVCSLLLNLFTRADQFSQTSDPVVVNALLGISSALSSSINTSSSQEEQFSISKMIESFIRKVNFGNDFEQQLNFYTKSRGLFGNLENVLYCLVCCVNILLIKTHRICQGRYNRKTSAFVRACLAYNFVTVPSFTNFAKKLSMYLLCGQMALQAQALAQADSFFKVAVTTFANSEEKELVQTQSLLFNLIAVIVLVPDSPSLGFLYLPKGIFNVIRNLGKWSDDNSEFRISAYIAMITSLCCLAQKRFPLHITGVQNNDELYTQDQDYLCEINDLISIILDEILTNLQKISEVATPQAQLRQFRLALELLNLGVGHIDLSKPASLKLVTNLYRLCKKLSATRGNLLTKKDFRQLELCIEYCGSAEKSQLC